MLHSNRAFKAKTPWNRRARCRTLLPESRTRLNNSKTNEVIKVMIKKLLLLLFAGIALVSATGCRTAHGAGEDIEAAGQKIQEHTPP